MFLYMCFDFLNFPCSCLGLFCRFGQDPTPVGRDREGHTRGAVQTQKPDGFTKSTAVHSHGPDVQSTATLRRLEPYVSR